MTEIIYNIYIIKKEAEHANNLINSLTEWSKNLQKEFTQKEKAEILDILKTHKTGISLYDYAIDYLLKKPYLCKKITK